MLTDLRYAIRSFIKTPSFTIVVILTLALGIGANTAIFTVVHAVLLRPFPYEDSSSILRVRRGTSHPDMRDWIERTRSFSAIAGFRSQTFDFAGAPAERLEGALVTGDLLRLFGARTILGRIIGPSDDRPGGERVVVISERLWRTRFASDPAIVGRQLRFNDLSYTVVGVMSGDFALPALGADVFAAFLSDASREAQFRGAHTLRAFVRLLPGVGVEQAQQEMDALAVRLEREYPESNREVRFRLQPLDESVVGAVRRPLLIVLATVGCVLLIACVNVANLVAARSAARRAELAVRAAIGASRTRIVSQLLTESVVLAIGGGILGLAVGYWLTTAIVALAPQGIPRLDGVSLDLPVLAFTAVLSLLTGVLFGVAPAWWSASASLAEAARSTARGSQGGGRTRTLLIVAEVALTLVLVVGAGLLLRSFVALTSQELGFDPHGVVTANLTLNGERYGSVPARTIFFEQFEQRVAALPGVRSVALTTQLPIGGNAIFHNLAFEGRSVAAGTEPEVYYRGVNSAYFDAFRIRLLKGRTFTPMDRSGAPLVAIVNEAFVREYYPHEDPVGRRIRWVSGNGEWMTIVGVVSDARAVSLEQSEVAAVHVPFAQEAVPWRRWMDVGIRADGDPLALAPALRQVVAGLDPAVPLTRVQSMERVLAAAAGSRRFNLFLLGGFALLALCLAAAGTYGVLAYTIEQRTRELGIRLALGAQPGDVFRAVVGRALAVAAIGVAIGLAAASVLARVLADMLFQVPPLDWPTFAVAALVLLLASAVASYVPARRAMCVDPLIALRSE